MGRALGLGGVEARARGDGLEQVGGLQAAHAPARPPRRSPNSEVSAGTSSERTMNVSMRMPTAITNANSRNERSGTMASSANEAASASPAAVTALAAAGVATAIASPTRAVRAACQMRPATNTL